MSRARLRKNILWGGHFLEQPSLLFHVTEDAWGHEVFEEMERLSWHEFQPKRERVPPRGLT